MRASIVVDLGFGDSGKGLVVDYLAGKAPQRSLVVRFAGGHQVGHTVVRDGKRHTFSSFGAGSLAGVPTYYLPATTIFPPAMMVERTYLEDIAPVTYAHPLAMVTTPYDLAYNRATESINQHGSCGAGFGATVERHQNGVTLFVKDLTNRWVARQKLIAIADYYTRRIASGGSAESKLVEAFAAEADQLDDESFLDTCDQAMGHITCVLPEDLPPDRPELLFEGNQGILLDEIHGFFPHVTRAKTTSQNALTYLRSAGWRHPIDLYYVTRCYQTRHGNGPMSSGDPVDLINNEHEANVDNFYQGAFRTSELDPGLLRYALTSDAVDHGGFALNKHLIVTCLDQRPDFKVDKLLEALGTTFETVRGSYGPDASSVQLLHGAAV